MSPDWTTIATVVPYAEFSDPQSLNLYSYVRNVPTVRFDADGHEVVLTGTKDEKAQEQERIVANASAKGEAGLFKTITSKEDKTRLVLDQKAAAKFEGKHSFGYNRLLKAINSQKTATVSIASTFKDPKTGQTIDVAKTGSGGATLMNKNGNSDVILSPTGGGGMFQKPIPLQNGGVERLTPLSIVAGHELLGHAVENMTGGDSSEHNVRHIENQLRQEQGMPLRKEED